ncbi:Hint domain-containing protein [Pseudosulfitobacter sp. DSM 107133]|uniref:Hint domain-containing protein n=1 Tax=Pseudosulfitobacter sp. DSM 107133 TaxID=2883100 RepID=UPI000DF4531A|nr:Hint domain-containing protein [Pseudosulfitobacter sp. DSM 107133]UOA28534.1 hypothetical protein DSM107133_03283 [Pseudosulfitobacter sp. DSM 107133]
MRATTGPDANRTDISRDAAVLTSFGPGTMVLTEEGEVPVEWLDSQHMLVTRDHGLQPILRINRIRLLRSDLNRHPEIAPVVLPPESFGRGVPVHHVRLSPNSLVLYQSWRAELHYGSNEVLVPGAAMAQQMPLRRPGDSVFVYTQILMQQHELLNVEAMWVGSLFIADLNVISTIHDPMLAAALGKAPMIAARPILTLAEAGALIAQDLGKDLPEHRRDTPQKRI